MEDHLYLQDANANLIIHYWGREITAEEKRRELHWPASRIMKTVYFDKDSKLYGFVLPLDKLVDLKSASEYLGLSKREAKSLRLSSRLPSMQSKDSAGPFISEVDKGLVSIILFDKLHDETVDFAYPGNSRVSIHLPYSRAYEIVKEQFPDIVRTAFL